MADTLRIKQINANEHGYQYTAWLVDGYVDGRRVRIRCKNEADAKRKLLEQQTKAINAERSIRVLATRLSPDQIAQAETAFGRLGDKYTLAECVDHFFRTNRRSDFEIRLSDAAARFLKSAEGRIRDRSINQLRSTLKLFGEFAEDAAVHEITTELVESWLNSLRAKNGVDKACRKTWNNHRAYLHQFLEWCTARPAKLHRRKSCRRHPAFPNRSG